MKVRKCGSVGVRKCGRVGRKLENVVEWGGSKKIWYSGEEARKNGKVGVKVRKCGNMWRKLKNAVEWGGS